MNRLAKKLTSLLLATMLSLSFIPAYATEVTTPSKGEGNQGDKTHGQDGLSYSHYDDDNQGLRFSVVDKNGNLVSKIVDIIDHNPFTNPEGEPDDKPLRMMDMPGGDSVTMNSNKLGCEGTYEVFADYSTRFPDMPLPVLWAGGGVPQGDAIKLYLEELEGNNSKIVNFVNGYDKGKYKNPLGIKLEGDEAPSIAMQREEYTLLVEPVFWSVPTDWVSGGPKPFDGDLVGLNRWYYGTYTEYAQVLSSFGLTKDPGNTSVSSGAGPVSLMLVQGRDESLTAGAGATAQTKTSGIIETSDAGNRNKGYALHYYTVPKAQIVGGQKEAMMSVTFTSYMDIRLANPALGYHMGNIVDADPMAYQIFERDGKAYASIQAPKTWSYEGETYTYQDTVFSGANVAYTGDCEGDISVKSCF